MTGPGTEFSDDYRDPRLAVFYDQMNGWGPDYDFHLGRVMSARWVLDVGCGTGMLLTRAREAGHTGRLVGLDPAAAMLDQARRNPAGTGVSWILGDLATVRFRSEFDLVVMTGLVLQHIITDEEIAATLAAVRAALIGGGTFAFETQNPRFAPWVRWPGSQDLVAADGTVVTATMVEPRLRDGGIVEVYGYFSSPSWPRELVCPSRFRFHEVDALDAFLAAAGLTVVERYGGWDGRPFTDDDPVVVTIAGVAGQA